MTNLYRWTTNLLGSAERRGSECRKMNVGGIGLETKVVPLSDCQRSDPLTGGASVAPFLVAREVLYLPVIWSAVYPLASERL